MNRSVTGSTARWRQVSALALALLVTSMGQMPAAADSQEVLTLTWDVPAWPDWMGDFELVLDGREIASDEMLASQTGMGQTLTVSLAGDVQARSPKVTTALCPGKQRGVVVKLRGVARATDLEVTFSHASHQHRTDTDDVDVIVRVCERATPQD